MKKLLAMAAAASALAFAAPAAAQSINERQAAIEHRIEAGLRSGDITRSEAADLRAQLNYIDNVESRYRGGLGMSSAERQDIDRRLDYLAQRVRYERRDDDRRGDRDNWQRNINERQRVLEWRINNGLREGSLSRREARELRSEFDLIVQLEADYRRRGLDAAERRDLDRRLDRLDRRIEAERQDRNNRYG